MEAKQTKTTFEFPLGIQASGDKRYMILEVVDFNQSLKNELVNIWNEGSRMVGQAIEDGQAASWEKLKDTITNFGARELENVQPSSREPVMDIIKSQNEKRSKKRQSGNTVFAIQLPYPQEFSEKNNQRFSAETGFASSIQKRVAGNAMKKELPILGMSTTQLIGQAQAKTGARQPVINPGYFQDYQGPTPRSFSFSWELMPNSAQEAKELALIIYNLKKFASPDQRLGGTTLLQPFIFNIKMQSETMSNLSQMDLLVCSDISVNYGTKANIRPDGQPKVISLSMEFQERRTLVFQDY